MLHSKHCHLCGRRLWGRGWVYTPNGAEGQALVVCRRCQEDTPRCKVCGMPMGADVVRLPDGWHICPHCNQTAVRDPAHAQALFERVIAIVAGSLGLCLNVGAGFALVNHSYLLRLAAETQTTPWGDPDKVVGLFVRKGRRRVMYILSGLPQILFIQTVAHEWAHAWQGENCPLLENPLVREGFAEWVAYKTLQALGAVKKMTLLEQQEGVYREGLRMMLELERQRGLSGVIAFCCRSE